MNKDIIYNRFLEELEHRIPQKNEIVEILTDILDTDKDSVFNKLKGESAFSFDEIMMIAIKLDISLDSLKKDYSLISRPFKFRLIEYINPAESGFALMEEMTEIMKSFNEVPVPEASEITNILPQPIYLPHTSISRFYLFKWKYQSNLYKAIPYKDINIDEQLKKNQQEYIRWAKRLHANYIFDRLIFQYLLADIRYFYFAGLITRDEIQLIRQDLLKILDEIDFMSRTGFFKDTGKKVNIYISDVNIDTNYIYVSTSDYQLTIIKAFIINGIATTDKKTCEELKHRIQSIKQQSILITGSAEKERVKFLEEQYVIIKDLSRL